MIYILSSKIFIMDNDIYETISVSSSKLKKNYKKITKNNSDKIVSWLDFFNNKLINLNSDNSDKIRNIIEIQLDLLNDFLERNYRETSKETSKEIYTPNISQYSYYPKLTNVDFNEKIYNKKEFNIDKMPLLTNEIVE